MQSNRITSPMVVFHTGVAPDYYEQIPSDGTQVAKGFREIPAGKYSISIQVKSLDKVLRHRSVFWGLHCTDQKIIVPEDDLLAASSGTAYGCLSEKQPLQTAVFYLPNPKTWYVTLTASNSVRKTRVAFFLYRLPDDPLPVQQPVSGIAHTPSPTASSPLSPLSPTLSPKPNTSSEPTPADLPRTGEHPADHPADSVELSSQAASIFSPNVVSAPAFPLSSDATLSQPSISALPLTPAYPSAIPADGSPHGSSQQQGWGSQLAPPGFNNGSTAAPASPFFSAGVVWPKQGDTIYSPTTMMSYTLLSTLGEGSFGVAMLGKDAYGQPYVLKAAKPFKAQAEIESDWRKEATLMLQLNHPNVIRLHECFAVNGLFWLVMEQAAGSLASYLSKLPDKRFPPKMIVQLAAQVFSGLEHIHLQGMIHRDLQMDNILFSKASAGPERLIVKICDFGIAKHLGYPAHSGLPAHTRIGREFDMSPGALMGYATNRSDIYQVGLILYHLYTGTPALSASDGPYYQSIPSGIAQKRACALKTDMGDVIAGLLYVNAHHLPATARHAWALFAPVMHYLTDPDPQ